MTPKITSFFPQSRKTAKDKSIHSAPILIKKVLKNVNTDTVQEFKELKKEEFKEGIQKETRSRTESVEQENIHKKRKWQEPTSKTVGIISNTILPNGGMRNQRVQLPENYLKLEKMFFALESTITFMKSRDQAIVFHRIQRAVQGMCNSNFELKHLGQMIHLVPGLYSLEPIKIMHLGVKKDSIVFVEKGNNGQVGSERVTFGGTAVNIPEFGKNKEVIRQAEMNTNSVYERRQKFRDALVDRTLMYYNKYLISIGRPKVDSLPFRWHSGFDVDSFPDLEVGELPLPESPKVAQEVVAETPLVETRSENIPLQNSKPANPAGKPKSKAAQLLERIKEKERKQKEMPVPIVDTAVLREKAMLQRMPEMVQSIKLLFAKENKNTLLLFKVCNHLANSMIKNPLSKDEALSHIKLLAQVAPNFISVCKTESGTSLKMNQVKFEEIEKTLQEHNKKFS